MQPAGIFVRLRQYTIHAASGMLLVSFPDPSPLVVGVTGKGLGTSNETSTRMLWRWSLATYAEVNA